VSAIPAKTSSLSSLVLLVRGAPASRRLFLASRRKLRRQGGTPCRALGRPFESEWCGRGDVGRGAGVEAQAVEELRGRGYRRFALAYSPQDERRLRDGGSSGFLLEQSRARARERFEFFRQEFSDDAAGYQQGVREFRRWGCA
jgi:hypothetical protein